MDDAADDPPIINTTRTGLVFRQKRLNDSPLGIRKPKQA